MVGGPGPALCGEEESRRRGRVGPQLYFMEALASEQPQHRPSPGNAVHPSICLIICLNQQALAREKRGSCEMPFLGKLCLIDTC